MNFRIADTFTDSLAKLTGQEQKAVKTTAFDLQLNPANPGMRFHRVDRARDPNFWSVRVNRDIRIIVHKTEASLLLAYVGHHDDAYKWAERRRIERHPKTGAAQLVEVRERVEEIAVVRPAADVGQERYQPPLFLALSPADLLGTGVPEDWLDAVRDASEDDFLDLAEHLPAEAAEALLDYVATGVLKPVEAVPADVDSFAHPDAQRRFRLLTNVEELERALDFPWEKWTVFLHPEQRRFVERDYQGPARIAGSAGTGKTVVALHRAVFLARHTMDARVLLTTFSTTLANALKKKLHILAGNEPDMTDRITVAALPDLALDLYRERFGVPKIATPDVIRGLLVDAAGSADASRLTLPFLFAEWTDVVDAWQVQDWEAYRDVARLGRKTRIGGKQRETLWGLFARVRGELDRCGELTWPTLFGRVADALANSDAVPFDFAVVDEAQDLGVPQLRFLNCLGRGRPDGLFFVGDLGQRIFQTPFSWKALGIDVRGRSHTLLVNYRTSHQIRRQADQLLPDSLTDVDGNTESRRGTTSVFNGPEPAMRVFDNAEEEASAISAWIMDLVEDGCEPHEIGVFVRSQAQLDRARSAVDATGLPHVTLTDTAETTDGHVSTGTMHLAKGLEFRAVAVVACDDEVIPLQQRIEAVADESDLEEVYRTERHLLYVACTRARDHLLVTGVATPRRSFSTTSVEAKMDRNGLLRFCCPSASADAGRR